MFICPYHKRSLNWLITNVAAYISTNKASTAVRIIYPKTDTMTSKKHVDPPPPPPRNQRFMLER